MALVIMHSHRHGVSETFPSRLPITRYTQLYTEQKRKRNNYISLNFEQTMILLEIIAFSVSALDIRLPNARNRFSCGCLFTALFDADHGHVESSKPHSAHARALK